MSFGFGFGFPKNYVAALFSTPASLFTTGVNGAWYDPSDISTMFQNAAGTTPVTAVGQPVGLMLDKSKGLVLGPELVTNGDFSSDTAWTKGADWAISGGVLSHTAGAANSSTTQQFALAIGSTYSVTCNITKTAGASITFRLGSTTSASNVFVVTANGSVALTAKFNVPALTFGGTLQVFASADFVGSIDNISVRELPGNHAFNSSGNSANFPVLSARYNLLTKTEQFDDAAWTKSNTTVAADAAVAPNGTTTASLFTMTATTGFIRQTYVNSVSAPMVLSVKVKRFDNDWIFIQITGVASSGVWFDLRTGSLGTVQAGITSATVNNLGGGWYEVILTFTAAVATLYPTFRNVAANLNSAGTLTSAYIWGADLRVANDALNQPAYQRVNTATDYDTVGFKPYLSFNGVNQWLQTNSIDFTYGDKMFVCAGVRKLSDAAYGVICECGTSASAAGSFLLGAGGVGTTYGFSTTGTSQTYYDTPGFAAPITNVVAEALNISGGGRADCVRPRINGVLTQTGGGGSTSAGTGNFGNYPLYLGARAGSSLWFNGRLYGLVVAGKAASASEIASTEAWLNQKTGAY